MAAATAVTPPELRAGGQADRHVRARSVRTSGPAAWSATGSFDFEVLRQKPIAEVDDQTSILADQAGKAVAPAPRTGNRVNQEKAYLSRPDYHDSGLEVGFFGRKDPQAAFVRRINVTSG